MLIIGNVAAKNARIAELEAFIEAQNDRLKGIELLMANSAALISIVKQGRVLRFGFARNGKAFYIETIGMMSDDTETWKRALLEPVDHD